MSVAGLLPSDPHWVPVGEVDVFRWLPSRRAATPTHQAVNFGDELAVTIVRSMLEDRVLREAERHRAEADAPVARLLSIGSVLHFARDGDTVWGAGINGKASPTLAADTLDVRAVRGPGTRAALLEAGIDCPAIFGDPALLLPELRPDLVAERDPTRRLSVIPNLNDLPGLVGHDWLVQPTEPWESVVRTILASELVVASSLHGIALAEAFGVPVRPLRSTAEPAFKYDDYAAGTGRGPFSFAPTVAAALEMGPMPPLDWDTSALRDAFPWDLWSDREAERDGRERLSVGSLDSGIVTQPDARIEPIRLESIGGVRVLAGSRSTVAPSAHAGMGELAAAMRLEIVRALAAGEEGTGAEARVRVLVGAAVLPLAEPGDVVWAGGLGADVERVLVPSAGVDHRGAAGPLAARAISDAVGDDASEPLGDPLLLLRTLFPEAPRQSARSGVGVLADVDADQFEQLDGVTRLELDGNPWRALDRIASCESIVTSSADGLALADALGIPARLVRDEQLSRAQLDDHALATGRDRPAIAASVAEALERSPLPAARFDVDALRASFPIELWRQPRVSVIVPTANVATWIDECLHSLLTQDLEDLEVIVVDDRSADGTVELARAVARRDRRVRVIAGAVTGGGSARNLGVRLARGEYLAFADGDDLVPAGAYRALVDSGDRSGSDLVLGRFLKFSASSTWDPTRSWGVFKEERTAVDLVGQPSIIRGRACWNKLYRAGFFRDAGIEFPDVPRSNDIVPVVTAYVRAASIDIVRDRVYLYRDRPGGTSMTAKAGQLRGLRSYLTQECLCLELVRETGDSALLTEYSRMIVQSDGWVLITRVLEALSESSAEDEEAIADRMRVLLGGLAPHIVAGLPIERAIVFALVAGGDLQGAKAALEQQTLLDAARALGGLDSLVAASDALAAGSAEATLHSALALAAARVALAEVEAGDRDAAAAAAAVARVAARAPADGPALDPRIGVVVSASLAGRHEVLEHLRAIGGGSIVARTARRHGGGVRIEGTAPATAVGARLLVVVDPDHGGPVEPLAELVVEPDEAGGAWSFDVTPGALQDGVWRLQVRLTDDEGPGSGFTSRLRWAEAPFSEHFTRADRVTVHGRVAERYEVKLHAFAAAPRRAARAVVRRLDPRVQRVVARAIGAARGVVHGTQSSSTSEAKRAGD